MTKPSLTIGIIGIGVVGSELINQLHANIKNISNKFNINLKIKAIAKSNAMIMDDDSIEVTIEEELLEEFDHTSEGC